MKLIEVTVSLRNNRMKKARLSHGLTQRELAKAAGVPWSLVTELETFRQAKLPRTKKGLREFADRRLRDKRAIAEFLDSTIEEMFPDELRVIKVGRAVVEIDPPRQAAIHATTTRLQIETKEKEIFNSIESKDMRRAVDAALENLSERERMVIKMRFGFDEQPKTLEEVGKVFNVNRERIRQIEAKAIRKLRYPGVSRPLRQRVYVGQWRDDPNFYRSPIRKIVVGGGQSGYAVIGTNKLIRSTKELEPPRECDEK